MPAGEVRQPAPDTASYDYMSDLLRTPQAATTQHLSQPSRLGRPGAIASILASNSLIQDSNTIQQPATRPAEGNSMTNDTAARVAARCMAEVQPVTRREYLERRLERRQEWAAPPAPADETTKDKGQSATAPPTWAAYVRVSTETQAKKKDQNGDVHGTHENQVEALTAWARAAGVRIELYQDPGVTGKDGQNVRGPIFQQMTADLTLKNLAGVVVTAVDRLGRETLDLLTVYRQFRDLGKSLLSLKEGDQKLENDDALMREILAVMASEERRRTAKRMGDGFRRKIAQGWRPGRKPKAINWKDAQLLLDAGASVQVTARAFGLSRTQLWRRMQSQGLASKNTRPFGKPKPAHKV